MKKLYNILWITVWSFIGVFIGYSGYGYYDYKKHPDLYAMRSAPWYLEIEILGIFIAIVVTVLLIIMWVIKKKIKSRELTM